MAKTRRQRARNGPDSQEERRRIILSQGNPTITNRSIGSVLNANSRSCFGNSDGPNCNLNQNKPTNNRPNVDGVVVSHVYGTEPITRSPCNDNAVVNGSVNAGPTVNKGCDVSSRTNMDATVKIDFDDIDEELVYWSSALVVYVLGADPPFSVFNGYCNRIWGKKGLDKVLLVGKGLYLVRFKSIEQREQIWNDEPKFFDSKPVIMKRWDSEMELHKETIKTKDRLTEQKERLAFARIMVEVDIQNELPDQINFVNEKGISRPQQQARNKPEQQQQGTKQQQQQMRANSRPNAHGQAQSKTLMQTHASTESVQGADIGDIGEFTP
ncbi:Formate-dependent phosphoribosylglycinamide formyltransferase, partial [Bienertia sinuspersici]